MDIVFGYIIGAQIWLLKCSWVAKYEFHKSFDHYWSQPNRGYQKGCQTQNGNFGHSSGKNTVSIELSKWLWRDSSQNGSFRCCQNCHVASWGGFDGFKTVLHILNVHILASLLECLCHCQRWFWQLKIAITIRVTLTHRPTERSYLLPLT
jgi:hypothetical protein